MPSFLLLEAFQLGGERLCLWFNDLMINDYGLMITRLCLWFNDLPITEPPGYAYGLMITVLVCSHIN